MLESLRPRPPKPCPNSSLAPACLHKSWGFGRVAEWSLLTGQIVIDFQSKKGHLMQAQYAAETLQPIPAEHILARKIADTAGVKKQAQDGSGLAGSRYSSRSRREGECRSNRRSARSTRFSMPRHFKKWWEVAKKKLKADGHFQLPAKKDRARGSC